MDADVELVLDTLYDRNPRNKQSGFVVNEAGLRLLKGPASIVSAIEQVLREIVDPGLSEDRAQARRFPGLDYVLGAYMVIGVKSEPERTVSFLGTLSAPLLAEAVQNIPVFFAPEGGGYNPGILPGHSLQAFVQGLSKCGTEDVKNAAIRVVNWMIENKRLS